ncbi:MAG: response regulator, partial [Verrucomicrobia bacterium]|nr:response regulator [Verrucomicrobiota bacterium]
NITEKKKLEAQFLRAQRMESIGTLASGIAHDLNNILAPILMAAQILRLKPTDEQYERVLGIVEANAERGTGIVKQLLTFARGVEGARVAIQPRYLLKEITKLTKETFPKNITTTFQVCSDAWTVLGDATQLHQVLLNLCVNARDAMPDGGTLSLAVENIEIDETFASMCEGAKAGAYVLLRVSDTGVGIPGEIQDKIFDPFFTTKEAGKGTGLGLATVLGIVKSHGGFLQLESEPGRGSVFKVFLPATAGERRNEEESKATELPPGQGEVILVVDDEVGIREMARSLLTAYGYQVLVAEDGAAATALFSQHADRIQVVLTDIGMPIMGGVALVRVLKRMRPQIKVIASSGFGSSSVKEGQMGDLEALGVDAVLAKPYRAELLLTLLHQLFRE